MTASDFVGLVMNVACLECRMKIELICPGEADMEYLRFAMVDPNDRMIMMHPVSLFAICFRI
jgi:hypothetical protein